MVNRKAINGGRIVSYNPFKKLAKFKIRAGLRSFTLPFSAAIMTARSKRLRPMLGGVIIIQESQEHGGPGRRR
jgi:hypothetical protein